MCLKLYDPDIKRAVVTDKDKSIFEDYYDYIIPANPDYGLGYVQKLKIYEYSPFDKTLFIDADCLTVRSVSYIFDLFKDKDISVLGKKQSSGKIFNVDFKILSKEFNLPYMVIFNGGVYYFRKSELAEKVYAACAGIIKKYDNLNLYKHRGLIADEPVMSISLGMHNAEPVTGNGNDMQLAGNSHTKLDVFGQICKFSCYDTMIAKPAIYHYGGDTYPFHVKREIFKLKLFYNKKINKKLASFFGNLLYNPTYAIYVFAYRTLKSIIKGKKLKLTPVLPPYKFL